MSDAGFAAGIALKTLDDLVRSEPALVGLLARAPGPEMRRSGIEAHGTR
ncbi:hypothetical protein AB2N04_00045 (plasmid) [Nitratireductor sp. GISD-1A_MAKvit]